METTPSQLDQVLASPARVTGSREPRYRGEVVYLFAFDVAYELQRVPGGTLLGQPVAEFYMDTGKRTPQQLIFHRPQMVRLPPMERIGPRGPVRVERTVKLLPVGAISIAVKVPFVADHVEDLYQLLQHDQNNRRMLVLEATIVLLFSIDLLLLFAGRD